MLPPESPILIKTGYGVLVRTAASENLGSFASVPAHSDDLLVACAEVGLPSGHSIWAADRSAKDAVPAKIADMVTDSVARFTIRQELPWTAEAYARYIPTARTWTNRFGDTYTFDDVVAAMLDQPIGAGTCLGIHIVYALTCLFRISESHGILSGKSRDRIAARLREVSAILERSRLSGGYWPARWEPGIKVAGDDPLFCLPSTGHHLEWIALAPPDLRPSVRVVEDAIAGICRFLEPERLTRGDRSELYLDLSHLARSLCLLANTDAVTLVENV